MRQQAIGFFLDYRITLATQFLQLWSVLYRNVPPVVVDDTEFLQLTGRFGDALSSYAEHVGDQFLGHRQFVGRQTIER
jgi:hypothetical protein